MSNRRARVHAYYRNPAASRQVLLEKSASGATQYAFHGARTEFTTVVRCDLNGYSQWARDTPIPARVDLLDDFFSSVIPQLEQYKGVYFRDEGDCLLCLFSNYFGLGALGSDVREFCKTVVSHRYGAAQLSAKAVVAEGMVAYYQKAHEVALGDWSAEGHPFVAAARLEQAVDSGQHVMFFADGYSKYSVNPPVAVAGGAYYWREHQESLRVEGLGFAGGWADVVRLEYLPGGRIQE